MTHDYIYPHDVENIFNLDMEDSRNRKVLYTSLYHVDYILYPSQVIGSIVSGQQVWSRK